MSSWTRPDRGKARGRGVRRTRVPRRSSPPTRRGSDADLTDIGAAIQISFIYFTVFYLTGLGGLFSERAGIVNIGLEGLMIIGTVSGAFGARFFTDTLELGQPLGPILGLLFGALIGALFAGDPRGRDRSRSGSITSCLGL